MYLKRQAKYKIGISSPLCRSEFPLEGSTDEVSLATEEESTILNRLKSEVLAGAYYLIDYRGYAGYEPGDNVVNIFSMGSLTTEAIKASEALLAKGVYANVIVVTSPDLLCGIQAYENDFTYLKSGLGINGNLYVHPTEHLNGNEFVTVAGRRVPMVSVHDGEAGLLDNLGAIVGVKHISLAVRMHSKCGRPKDIYAYHGIDADSVVDACGKVLSETALEEVKVSQTVLGQVSQQVSPQSNWSELWPTRPQNRH